jgi:hypothetical protein
LIVDGAGQLVLSSVFSLPLPHPPMGLKNPLQPPSFNLASKAESDHYFERCWTNVIMKNMPFAWLFLAVSSAIIPVGGNPGWALVGQKYSQAANLNHKFHRTLIICFSFIFILNFIFLSLSAHVDRYRYQFLWSEMLQGNHVYIQVAQHKQNMFTLSIQATIAYRHTYIHTY